MLVADSWTKHHQANHNGSKKIIDSNYVQYLHIFWRFHKKSQNSACRRLTIHKTQNTLSYTYHVIMHTTYHFQSTMTKLIEAMFERSKACSEMVDDKSRKNEEERGNGKEER